MSQEIQIVLMTDTEANQTKAKFVQAGVHAELACWSEVGRGSSASKWEGIVMRLSPPHPPGCRAQSTVGVAVHL